MCSRCRKRVAVVFVTKYENGKATNEGLCLSCAKELGIKPVNDMLEKMGISDEDMERMSGELEGAVNSLVESESPEDGGAPAIDFPKIFQNMGLQLQGRPVDDGAEKKNDKQKKSNANGEKRKFLTNYCRNLTALAADGKLDPVIGRDKELARVIQILSRRQKNNPCLIGEPGVGKTAIAEALALRIVEGNVPYKLRNAEIMLLDLTALVAGTQFRGQFESRILGLLAEVRSAKNIILVIDEVHNLVGAGDAEGSMNAANMMKPALSRGEIQVIGATTLAEYRKHIEKDSALERRFQPIVVNEPSVDETVDILKGIKKHYETFHGVNIPEHLLRRVAVLSERYITDRFLPDKAIDLLDESVAKRALASPCIHERRAADEEMRKLGEEKDTVSGATTEDNPPDEETYRKLADIKVRELQLTEKLRQLENECAQITLCTEDIANVLEIWTGIPAASIDAHEFERLAGLEERISSHVIGQKEAVSAVVRAVKRKRAGISYKKTPVSMIFAGPTGVGKTELVKVLAEDLFKEPESLIRLDMSEFMEKHAVSRIIGAPPGYVGYDDAGQLTEKIRRRPYSVILFDEIEKAHPDVMNILLQVLDEGHITDAGGRRINFENTVIVMTTNAGADRSNAITGFSDEHAEEKDKERTERALSQFLRPEFLNRVDEIITFRHLDKQDFACIARLRLQELSDVLAEKGIKLSYDDAAVNHIAEESYSYKYGARNMQRYLRTHVEDVLAEKLIMSYRESVSLVTLSCIDGQLTVTCAAL